MLKLKTTSSKTFAILLLLLSTGCKREITTVGSYFHDSREFNEQDYISLKIFALGSEGSKKYFYNIDLPSKGIIPLQISIVNETPYNLVLRENYIPFKMTNPELVAKSLHWDTFTITMYSAYLTHLCFWPAWPLVYKASTTMKEQNAGITKSINEIAFEFNEDRQKIVIEPFDKIIRFMFINQEDYVQNFDLKLFNQDLKNLIKFHVKLENKY